jgi:phosphatidate cytidylyltransferase
VDDYDDEEAQERPRPRAEGVRIIGAEEAARALQEGQAAGRRPEDAPRFGDVPERPSGPPPAQRFPLPEEVDPADAVRRPPVVRSRGPSFPPGEAPEMPHWTEPPSGEVPRILAPETEAEGWSGLTPSRGPRWRDRDSDWADSDFEDVASFVGDEARLGALDVNRTEHSDLFSFDEPQPEPEPQPDPEPERRRRPAPVTTSIRTRQPRSAEPPSPPPPSGGRDIGMAVGVGAAMAAVAMVLFKAGPKFTLVLAMAAVTLAAVELYDAFRRAGHRPATLLGLTATVSIMLAAYSQGEVALPLIMVLLTVFTFLWYLLGVVRARPTVNVAVTLLGFLWVGFFGSFAALLLTFPNREGIAFLLGAVIGTAAYDIGGLFFGSQLGRRPLLPEISPNKTVEGLIGGMAAAVFFTVLIVGVLPGIHPWTPGNALGLGLMVAVVAPLGDLCESMVKRDLGIKDMGALLPGHGGVLDRFDSLLFVLPATYYLVKLLNLG